MFNFIIRNIKGDKYIWLIAVSLSAISILVVYSSTTLLVYKENKSLIAYLLKHGAVIVSGLVIMYFIHLMDYRHYIKLANVLVILAIPLLLYTLLFGAKINEASRWITLPFINKTFQTSDFAKFALILYLAKELGLKQKHIKEFKSSFLPCITAIIAICALIAPSNLSTSLLVFFTSTLLLIVGRVSLMQLLFVLLLGFFVATLTMFFGPRREVYENRITAFLNYDKDPLYHNYQTNHALIAIKRGGIFGRGPGNSQQRNYLPSPYSDFIFPIIIEEYGLVGGLITLFLYVFFAWRCIKISLYSQRAFATLLVLGLSFSLTIQALINIAVAVNLLPVTGLPLPLISMGGTSVLFTCISFGIILNISKSINETQLSY